MLAILHLALAATLQAAPPAAEPTPPAAPPATAPAATPPAATPDAPPATPPAAEPEAPPTAPRAPAAPPTATPLLSPAAHAGLARQVWVFIDRWKEFGGDVVEETELEIVVERGAERRRFNKAQMLEIVELVKPQPGQYGVVELRDGSRVRGEILRDDLECVEFRVDSVSGKLPRKNVYRVVLEPDFEERYAALKASIAPDEHTRRVALAKWLIDQGQFIYARQELEALLRDADRDDARTLMRHVEARIKLNESIEARKRKEAAEKQAKGAPPAGTAPAGTAPAGTAPATTPQPAATAPAETVPAPAPTEPAASTPDAPATATPATTAPAAPAHAAPPAGGPPKLRDVLPKNLLSNEDVNLIRVYEINFADPPRMTVSPEGVRQLILRYASSALIPSTTQERNALYTKPPQEIARLFFDLRARDLYKYIEVDEDPPALAKFRTRVHNSWLLGNCATSRCHGGVEGGRFFLYTGNAKDERIRYTNLMTLLSFKVDGRPVVNFEDPESSLLVQYAMPRTTARFPHPDVKGWKPVFSPSTPQLHADTIEWIRSMYQPRPTYPVDYVPPKLDAPDKPVRTLDGPDR
ncbi:MAG: hypothetical protein U0625_08735 [Phycisphaerales bacterium]